ncbi:hypothetical protein [Phytohabitans kaempferiae]|uniref:RES domain-containing protein n=1 Tax=Phytohabitans kaempferiae TaxID=1620943 RepID=A0ABV6MF75_9ACTN
MLPPLWTERFATRVPGEVWRSSEDGGSYAAHLEDLDVPDATFGCPDLTTFCRPDELGLVVVGQRLEPDRRIQTPSTSYIGEEPLFLESAKDTTETGNQ